MATTETTKVIDTIEDIREQVKEWRAAGKTVALVPTMGALHKGHLSLVDFAKIHADKIVVSIFVNPTQFGPNEDLDAYPRQEKQDVEKLSQKNVDVAFIPSVDEMYDATALTEVSVGKITEVLCGAFRPTHFTGVTTIVSKIFMVVTPDVAVFGEKDFQQLQVIKKMTNDLKIPVDVVGAPLLREADGLAISSRNVYLTADQRHIAGKLNQVLKKIITDVKNGGNIESLCQWGEGRLHELGFDSVDYLEIRDEERLSLVKNTEKPCRIFAAAKIGDTRLIDNMAI
ncbi:MAG: pantoate--beta-alanine ligase [Alphaproteobacteria bacterium]|nr:pantoate--beta-alanine ligase [Alphaproteobacteria bacterium]